MTTRRIVVHTDFSEASAAAVHLARMLADGLGATLDFLHVMQEPLQAGWTAEMSTASLPEVQQAMQMEAEQWLDRVLPESEQERLGASLRFETGNVANEIVRYAQENKADMVVMSATPGANDEQVGVSVAQRVLARCTCSVLVAR